VILSVAAAGVLLLAGCDVEDPAGEGAEVVDDSNDAGGPTPDDSEDNAESEDDAESDGDDGPEELGTRSNPVEIGTTVAVGDWEVEILEVTLDATEEIQAENQFNDPPSEGFTFVMWETEATYVGEDSGDPRFDLRWAIVGSEGNSFDDGCGVTPDPLDDQGETFPDGVVSGNVCIAAEQAQLDGGTITVEGMMGSDRVFFAIP
jgi:hypothetical protein